ncbi:FtsH protease activity modulator HflK [Thalassotalea sp. HSM 43]|uniref:FtsH protease activity modulator HflK n=1 Tax=Thalassotalea sp. HSM 43 TaxID=2552945 RepID=UPI001081CE85|nr:FtsH protease activity modulator HflK [Thalassotalea sp. HSM 43]QBY04659.1 FtsH protease activity modulator HflK [Thalassotalea sp. HSM 43]
MAWNEPGKNDNDPWKNKGGRDQGPPDLDELLKDLGNKFGGMFGGKKPGKPGGGSSFSGFGASLVVIIALVVWAFSGFYTIKEAQKGVVLQFGEYNTLVDPGIHWQPTFIQKVIPVDVQTTRNIAAKGFMLTEDENLVSVEMQVQYRIIDARNYLFNVTNADNSLEHAFDSAIRYVIGHSKMDEVLTSGREQVRQSVWAELEKIIEPYNLGILISDVNFKNSRPPEQVKDAFDDAIAAREDEERFILEAEAYALSEEPKARGEAKRIEQQALGYSEQVVLEAQGNVAKFNKLLPEYQAAPEVTRQRLYLATMEKVYSNTSKVMVDVEGGNNMMYLPLDKIMQQQSSNLPQTFKREVAPLIQRNPTQGQNSSVNSSSSRNDRFNRGGN